VLAAVLRRDNPAALAQPLDVYARAAVAYPDLAAAVGAVLSTQDAVKIRRRLAAANAAAHEPNLAGSLNNLSNRLGDVGRRDEALAAIQDAVEIRRRLAAANAAAYEPDLALSLNNLSIRLGDVGRKKESDQASREAVDLGTSPDLHQPAHPLMARNVSASQQGL